MKLDARAHKSRQALIEAGIQLLSQNPSASLKEVAELAGVGRATLYRHFESREQLIQEIALESLLMMEEVLQPIRGMGLDGIAGIETTFRALLPLGDRYNFMLTLWDVIEKSEETMQVYGDQLSALATMVEQARADGSINPALSTEWIVALVDGLLYIGWSLLAAGHMEADAIADQALLSLKQGVCS